MTDHCASAQGLDDDLTRIAFAGMHPDRVRSLLASHGTPSAVVASLRKGRERAEPATVAALAVDVGARRRELLTSGIELIGPDRFPPSLVDRPDAPPFLFTRGVLPAAPTVAIVGTRRCTAYGRRIARSYGAVLSDVGVPVVSGLARGIDGAAHEGVRAEGGVGVAVMGCGLDRVYPREHRSLLTDLLAAGGAAVSEYPPGAPPTGWRFPARNRVISLLAEVVIVVEANETGGALITARHAIEQGKEVLATPGDITRRSSAGTNLLIRDGALPVFDADDLVAALELIPGFADVRTVSAKDALRGTPAGLSSGLGEEADLLGLISRSGTDIHTLGDESGTDSRLLDQLAGLERAGAIRIDGRIATRLA